MRVLVLEDEPGLLEPILAYLRRERLEAVGARSLAEAYRLLEEGEPEVMVVDVRLPEGEDAGFRFAEAVRRAGYRGGILFLTARDALEDRVRGLDLGGDDYLVKPFHLEELLARVRALLRRGASFRGRVLERGPLRVDFAERRVLWKGKEVALSGKEFALLELLALHPEKAFPREELLDRIFPGAESEAILRVYVQRLRQKLAPWVVERVPGGYRLGSP
ncbi:DNA-binding response regulator (plasmid) [Thermus thermophilus]|uniref:DNA-binding response regulator n=1 Tax=Thermus thermophilus TaxID=274 RepID=A0AAD1KW44_THETH|nr:response regulator transcription factor [Thermus thermophilus]BBL83374.1 DNA-binding response regulator [Thermus thermophilus]BBL85647.1 DNA-binding response regulator [Thermus thermophilus]BCZ87993.1 DNA-binding response regulator [Thermus thermophilus]BCZ90376.1 DNA-binding response regulator [Thermus thermophilus]BCZ92996.1 DNA-binding response regulator [Thermus thermophilus]